MKNHTAFFFYYSLVMVTVLTVGVFLIVPIPYNFFLLLIFGPMAVYFWLNLSQVQPIPSSKDKHSDQPVPVLSGRQKIKSRLIYGVLIVAITSFITFFILTILKNLSETSLKQVLGIQTQTSSDLQKLKEELKTLQAVTETNTMALGKIQQLQEELKELQTEIQNNKKDNTFNYDTSLLFPTINLSPSPTPKPLTGFVTINSSKWQSVDVLQDKIPSSRVVGQAVYGKNYEFLKKEQDYYYIVLSSSIKGWIHVQFVKEISLDTR